MICIFKIFFFLFFYSFIREVEVVMEHMVSTLAAPEVLGKYTLFHVMSCFSMQAEINIYRMLLFGRS